MRQIHNLVITGCGTSLHAGIYGAKLMRDFEAFDTAMALDAAEVLIT
jgi:glucosamine 6-phosphate synthetase-like amidotransferase/phosphosugar isomerase protein